jgi:hypothetical protein
MDLLVGALELLCELLWRWIGPIVDALRRPLPAASKLGKWKAFSEGRYSYHSSSKHQVNLEETQWLAYARSLRLSWEDEKTKAKMEVWDTFVLSCAKEVTAVENLILFPPDSFGQGSVTVKEGTIGRKLTFPKQLGPATGYVCNNVYVFIFHTPEDDKLKDWVWFHGAMVHGGGRSFFSYFFEANIVEWSQEIESKQT